MPLVRPGASRGASAFPQIRFVSLLENGTHVLFGSRLAGCAVGEQSLLARDGEPALSAGSCCAWRTATFSATCCGISSPRNRGGSVVAHQEESASAAGDAVGRRLLSESDLSLPARPVATNAAACVCG